MQWNYAFDPGAETIRMALRGSEGLYAEPDWAAYRPNQSAPFVRGDRALELRGRECPGLTLKQCARNGVPTDNALAARWLYKIMSQHDIRLPGHKNALIAVSPYMHEEALASFEHAMLEEQFNAAGVVPSDFAAALGAGIDISEGGTHFVLDIGASAITWSAIVQGRRVKVQSLPFGMDRGEDNIITALKSKMGVFIGRQTAKMLKHMAFDPGVEMYNVPVLNPEKRLPEIRSVSQDILVEAMREITGEILRLCSEAQLFLPEGCASDLLSEGLMLTGGGSNIKGIESFLSRGLDIPVHVAEEPELCVINGLKRILAQQDKYAYLVIDWREQKMKQ